MINKSLPTMFLEMQIGKPAPDASGGGPRISCFGAKIGKNIFFGGTKLVFHLLYEIHSMIDFDVTLLEVQTKQQVPRIFNTL